MIHTEKFVFGLAFDGVAPTGVMKSALCSVEERLLPPPPRPQAWRLEVWRISMCLEGRNLQTSRGKAVASGQ